MTAVTERPAPRRCGLCGAEDTQLTYEIDPRTLADIYVCADIPECEARRKDDGPVIALFREEPRCARCDSSEGTLVEDIDPIDGADILVCNDIEACTLRQTG